MNIIKEFKDEYRFLSNFWLTPVLYGDLKYPSVENAFQAAKCKNDTDKIAFTRYSASQAKYAGRHVTLRPDWNTVRLPFMLALLRLKFQNTEMATKLLATGDAILQEGNYWHDTFWGIDLNTDKGENNLGKLLMQVRKELQEKEN